MPGRRIGLIVLLATLGVASLIQAQSAGERVLRPTHVPRHEGSSAASFRFCRVQFRTSLAGDGAGWYVDFPRADINLSLRLAQLTRTGVDWESEGGDPAHVVIGLTDDQLAPCPFIMMSEVGGADLSDDEAAALGRYLRKGGFLWADDFWGSRTWRWWSAQLARVLPPSEFPIVELPMDHPLYHTMFDIREVPQIPNIGLWESSHITSERGGDSPASKPRAIVDRSGRVMVFMTGDTDFGDAFERESESPDYFARFSVPAYQIGVNVILYALTH